jgi:4-hydroxy-4-methyl-2-oxoglutarate aldolase
VCVSPQIYPEPGILSDGAGFYAENSLVRRNTMQRLDFDKTPPTGRNGYPAATAETLRRLREFDTCTIANAVERFRIRLRNEGYTRPGGLRPMTAAPAPLLGYAATFLTRTSDPPMTGNYFEERMDWWDEISLLPVPRIAVIQHIDAQSGAPCGSVVGEIHAAVLKAFRCDGLITNGAVRDLPAVTAMGFPMFAPFAAVSHSYAHVVEYGGKVEVFGLEIRAGDLVMADLHGAVSIPLEIAADVPSVAAELLAKERRIVDVCRSPDFSPERLVETLKAR